MRYTVRLVRILNEKNLKLIARRVAGDFSVDLHSAESLLYRLPVEILRGATVEKSQQWIFEYEKMGCLMEKEEERPSVEVADEKPRPTEVEVETVTTRPPVFSHPPEVAPLKKTNRRWAAWAGASVLAAFLISFFVPKGKWGVPLPALPDVSVTRLSGASQEEIDRKVAEADTISSLEERVEALKSALALNSSYGLVKRRLSQAYAQKAGIEYSAESRIKFYKIAISFNPANAVAWEGLAQAQREAGSPDDQRRTAVEWKKRIRDSGRDLSKVITSFNSVAGLPRIVGDTLNLRYRSNAGDLATIEAEMKMMAEKIREARNFEQIRMTAQGSAGEVTRAF